MSARQRVIQRRALLVRQLASQGFTIESVVLTYSLSLLEVTYTERTTTE